MPVGRRERSGFWHRARLWPPTILERRFRRSLIPINRKTSYTAVMHAPLAAIPRPTAWLLRDGQPGNETQVLGLAALLEAAGVDVALRKVRANRRHRLGAAILGGHGWSIDRRRSDALEPPWPDLAIGAGRRSGPWARYVKAASGGRTRAVMLGQKGVNRMADLDLAVALAHWRLPAHARRRLVDLPPTAAPRPTSKPAKPPHVLLLVGGRCFDHAFAANEGAALAARAATAASAQGATLSIATSRRTGAAAEAAMAAAAPEAETHFWRTGASTLDDLLAAAAAVIVTGDSESMIAEAVAARLPTYVAPARPRLTWRMTMERGAFRLAGAGGPVGAAVEALWSAGVLLPPRDLGQMLDRLEAYGYVRRFVEPRIDLDWRPAAPDHGAVVAALLRLAARAPETVAASGAG